MKQDTIILNCAQAAAVTRLMTKIMNGFSLYHVSSIEISEEDDKGYFTAKLTTNDKDERTIVSKWREKNGFVSLVQVGIDIECLKD